MQTKHIYIYDVVNVVKLTLKISWSY